MTDSSAKVPLTASDAAPWIKICGIKSVALAGAVEQAGGDAIGLVFYSRSARYLPIEHAAEIAQSTNCTRVGLFVDPQVADVEQVLAHCPLDVLQFHGDESPEFCSRFGLPYMKAISSPAADRDANFNAADRNNRLRERIEMYADAWAMLLDTHLPGMRGGTGHKFDWSLWPGSVAANLVLAGGLDASNVADGIRRLSPWGVDVSGGVEGPIKGEKEAELIRDFIAEVRRVG